ncbi:MAG TPA: DUF362 domain-containing protein [bacterium]|nr:DUF362 domain-containing protein [bacterium]HPR89256.1 DUF362 domain-containing protein [bacterium]
MKRTKMIEDARSASSRRDFIRQTGAAAAGLMLAPWLKSPGVVGYNRKQEAYRATVALADTANTPADSYLYDDPGGGVRQKVKYLLDLLEQNQPGSIASLFGSGRKVAIKINLTGGSGNATSSRLGRYTITEAVWTHPAVIQAVGQYLLEAGVQPADLYLVEAFWDTGWQKPGSTAPFGALDKFGYRAVQQALGCQVVDLNDLTPDHLVEVATGSSYFNLPALTMNKILQTVDVFISLPKLKHHSAAGYTGALKNQVGIVPYPLYTITGDSGRRGALHHPATSAAEWNYLPESICDLHAARPVHLAVIDAIRCATGGEGTWCANFVPCAKHALLAGVDPVATDSIGAVLMGLDPGAASLPLPAAISNGGQSSEITDNHLHLLHGQGAGTNQLDEIQLVGDGSGLISSVESGPLPPSGFRLCANFPNPFNPATMIVFFLPERARVSLRVHDLRGRLVATLLEGELPAGEHRLQWSATGLASGVYFCRMTAPHYNESIRMIYQR